MDASRSIIPFEHDRFGRLRAMEVDGEPWFVASDVAKALGYGDATHMTRRLEDDEKGLRSLETPGGAQRVSIITEAGLYNAILGSKLPQAWEFKRWVTHEVLPSIRRHGSYASPATSDDMVVLRAMEILNGRVAALADENARLAVLNAEMAPKAMLVDEILDVDPTEDGLMTVTHVCRELSRQNPELTRDFLYDALRRRHRVEAKPSRRATKLGESTGYVVNKWKVLPSGVRMPDQCYVTQRGIAYILSEFVHTTMRLPISL